MPTVHFRPRTVRIVLNDLQPTMEASRNHNLLDNDGLLTLASLAQQEKSRQQNQANSPYTSH